MSTPAGESTVLLAVAVVAVVPVVVVEGVEVVTGAGVLLRDMPGVKSGLGVDAEKAVWTGAEDDVVDVVDWGFVVAGAVTKERPPLGGG